MRRATENRGEEKEEDAKMKLHTSEYLLRLNIGFWRVLLVPTRPQNPGFLVMQTTKAS